MSHDLLDRFLIWLAWRLPRRLAYWCAIRVMSHATVGPYSGQHVPEMSALDGLSRWNKPA